jgi:hypothetical protein
MGQALDESGNVLGEAFGNTKREVFDKLQAAHANAAEIRIRKLMQQRTPEASDEACDKTLSQRVADLEKLADESRAARNAKEDLDAIEATLWLNFGDTESNKAGFVIKRDKPLRMLIEVLEKLTAQKQQEK